MKAKIYEQFSLRENLNEAETLLATSHGVMFLSDKKGNDWYELQKGFSANTLKIVFDENGVINSASYDASTLWPQSFSLAEVDVIPESFDIRSRGDKWVFNGKKIIERVYSAAELTEQAEAMKGSLLATASQKISPLQDAKELGIATDAELAQLKQWMLYRVLVSRIDTAQGKEITWPEVPTDVA